MKDFQLRPFCFCLAVVVFIFAVASTVNGQTPFRADEDKAVDCWDQSPLRGGEGSWGFVPSWFVMLKVEERHYTNFGSGAFITDRIVLTCHHNIRGGDDIDLKDGTGHLYENVRVLLQSPKLDLCLLFVDDENVPYHRVLSVSDSDFTPKGTVHSVGYNPSDDAICRYEGKLKGKSYGVRGLKGPVSHAHSAKVVQGMSGGPLLNNYGEIVGVNIASSKDVGSLAVNLTRLQWFLDQYDGSKTEE